MTDAAPRNAIPSAAQFVPAVVASLAYLASLGFLLGFGYAPHTSIGIVLVVAIGVLTTIGIISSVRWAVLLDREQGIARKAAQRIRASETTSAATTYIESLPESWCRSYLLSVTGADQSVTLEDHAAPGPALVRYLAGAVMLIGLLGTFLGLIDAVGGYELVLRKTTAASTPGSLDVSKILGGLNRAFVTTTFGIISSLTLSALHVVYRGRERALATHIKAFAAGEPLLRSTADNPIARIIANTVNQLLPAVIREATERLLRAAKATEGAASSHAAAAERFERGAITLGEMMTAIERERSAFTMSAAEVAANVSRLNDWHAQASATLHSSLTVVETLATQLAAHDTAANKQAADIASRLAQVRADLSAAVSTLEGKMKSSDVESKLEAMRGDLARILRDLQTIAANPLTPRKGFVDRFFDLFR